MKCPKGITIIKRFEEMIEKKIGTLRYYIQSFQNYAKRRNHKR